MTLKFIVICKNCGSENVDLIGDCCQNYGYGVLSCNDCGTEEDSTETDD